MLDKTTRRRIARRVVGAWIPLVVIAASAVGAFTVFRLHSVFGSDHDSLAAARPAEKIIPTNPKHVVYEVFGPQATSGLISYLDEKAQPIEAHFTTLPWSFPITTTLPSVVANLMAQGDASSIGCRIIVNGVVRDEQQSQAHNASAFCLVKAA